MKIGFYFECFKSSGGVYQYALNLLDVFKEDTENSYVIFSFSPDFPTAEFDLPNWKIVQLLPKESEQNWTTTTIKKPSYFSKQKMGDLVRTFLRTFHLYTIEIYLTTRNAKKRARILSAEKLDLLFFHGPSELSFLIPTPSVVPIHDLQHRTSRSFPEVSQFGQWYKREYLYNNIKRKVYRILVDSEIGREDVNAFYHIPKEKIVVLPPLPPKYIDTTITREMAQTTLTKHALPEKFFFYPAQFWPHKNHLNLLKALHILKETGEAITLVLSGSGRGTWGTLDKVRAYIKENQLEKQVFLLGYVSNDEMSALYRRATGFIMPTHFGWTNFPLVEAWQMDCPAIYSSVRGCKEQAGDAALLVDPSSPEDTAEKMRRLWNDQALRQELISKGKKRLSRWTKKEYRETIMNIIAERQHSLADQTK